MARFRPRFSIRWLMVAVAIAALLMLPVVWLIQVGNALNEFYRPGGTLERQGRPK